MAFDPAFLEELRARTPIASAIGRRTKITRSGRNWKACCPFHGEKTPSFYVYDDHFHCFGCGAHGDVISFVMQSSGQSFLQTVQDMAREAGLELPREDPSRQAQAARARTLTEALEAAQRSFARRLLAPEGAAGLAYLRNRGLSDQTIAGFGLGWSGDGRGGLEAELAEQGMSLQLMAEAGLMRLDEAGAPKGALFFNRVTFPIRDRRGGLVSFGGRTLGDGQPKYLNGPETALFSKRLILFGLDRAKAASGSKEGRRSDLVVVEGYMDVIAMQQAGFSGAVAPLGTALTSEQLEALWRISPAPRLCFDGDAAGRRAAVRAAETAMPSLDAERSLLFCQLPEGQDPDSLLRTRGAGIMGELVQAARPLADILFELLSEGIKNPGPEQRAGLQARLVEAAGRIGNRTLAGEYRRTLLDRFFETYRSGRGGASNGNAMTSPAHRSRAVGLPRPRLLSAGEQVRHERLRLLTAMLLRHPELLHDVEEAYCSLELPPDFARLREALLGWVTQASAGALQPHEPHRILDSAAQMLDSQALVDHLNTAGLSAEIGMVLAEEPLPLVEQMRPSDMPAELEMRWWHFFGLLSYGRLMQERDEAVRDWVARNDEISSRRMRALSEVCAALRAGEQTDDGWNG